MSSPTSFYGAKHELMSFGNKAFTLSQDGPYSKKARDLRDDLWPRTFCFPELFVAYSM